MRRLLTAVLFTLLLLVPGSPVAPVSATSSTSSVVLADLPASASPTGADPASRPAFAPTLDAVTDRAIAEGQIVGAVVLVAEDGQLVYHRAAGLADREAGTPIREESIFRLASMTKPVVSAATLALVEQGRLRLDDPVTRYLPEF